MYVSCGPKNPLPHFPLFSCNSWDVCEHGKNDEPGEVAVNESVESSDGVSAFSVVPVEAAVVVVALGQDQVVAEALRDSKASQKRKVEMCSLES